MTVAGLFNSYLRDKVDCDQGFGHVATKLSLWFMESPTSLLELIYPSFNIDNIFGFI